MMHTKSGAETPHSKTRAEFRRIFLGALAAGTVLIILLTIWTVAPTLWPGWREQNIERAISSSGPAFWWPPNWRIEYQARMAQRNLHVALMLEQQLVFANASVDSIVNSLELSNGVLLASGGSSAVEQQSRLAVIRSAPEFKLGDQSGAEIRTSDLRGKVVLVSFIFTTCNGSCPATTHRMSLVQRELKSRGLLSDASIHLLSITLDPQRDTPEVLRRYMQLYDADASHWSFLTGPADDVQKTIDDWGMWVRPSDNGQLDHPSRIFLVDSQGRIREIYNLSFMNPEWVADDIKLLLDEANR